MNCRTLFTVMIVAGISPLAAQSRALDVDDVTTLLGIADMPANVRADVIRQRCVSFVTDEPTATKLRKAGADETLLAVLRSACFTGAELVVESFPSGADVLLGTNPQVIARTPWTYRYETTGWLVVTVRANGKQQASQVQLKPGARTRAFFGFPEEPLSLPSVRTVAEVERQLNIASRWQPIVPEPKKANIESNANGVLFVLGGMLAGGGVGAGYCTGVRCAGLGEDRIAAGMFIGMGAGLAGGWLAMHFWDRNYDRLTRNHDDWSARNIASREAWVSTHPDIVAAIRADRQKRDQVVATNAQIQARNNKMAASVVTSERLPGPVAP